jgi:hypothetical protein
MGQKQTHGRALAKVKVKAPSAVGEENFRKLSRERPTKVAQKYAKVKKQS